MTNETWLNTMTHSYIETALWCGVEYPMGDPRSDHDKDYKKTADDLHPDTEAAMKADCFKFFHENLPLLLEVREHGDWVDFWAQVGHDFWLTRNGHGAGFWDGDYPEPFGDQLTAIAKTYGEFDLYTGDDSDRVYHL